MACPRPLHFLLHIVPQAPCLLDSYHSRLTHILPPESFSHRENSSPSSLSTPSQHSLSSFQFILVKLPKHLFPKPSFPSIRGHLSDAKALGRMVLHSWLQMQPHSRDIQVLSETVGSRDRKQRYREAVAQVSHLTDLVLNSWFSSMKTFNSGTVTFKLAHSQSTNPFSTRLTDFSGASNTWSPDSFGLNSQFSGMALGNSQPL